MSLAAQKPGIWLGFVVLVGSWMWPGRPARAATPPLATAMLRQRSLRSGAFDELAGRSVDIDLTVTAGALTTYRAVDAHPWSDDTVELDPASPDAANPDVANPDTANPDRSLTIGAGESLPWATVHALLFSRAPIAALTECVGAFAPDISGIDTVGQQFIYTYGKNPKVGLTRDLAAIRRVWVDAGGKRWEFRLSGALGVGGIARHVVILRDGAPFANLELTGASGKHPAQKHGN